MSNFTHPDSGLFFENITLGTNSDWVQAYSWTSGNLKPATAYNFRVKARNSDQVETSFSPNYLFTTLAEEIIPVPEEILPVPLEPIEEILVEKPSEVVPKEVPEEVEEVSEEEIIPKPLPKEKIEPEILEEIIDEEQGGQETMEEEEKEISAPEVIKLTPKSIKTEDNKKELSKENYVKYGFVIFCILLGFWFILKGKTDKNEFD